MRVDIIGASPGFEEGLNAPGYKVGINYWHPQLDALCEIHPLDHPYNAKLAPHRENAKAAGCRLITCETFSMPVAMEVLGTDYFSCSMPWAIAWTLLNTDADEIHLWGCAMDDRGDHYEKRAGVDFWCGYAMGNGVKVHIHGNSTVMTTEDGNIYGLFIPMVRQHKLVALAE